MVTDAFLQLHLYVLEGGNTGFVKCTSGKCLEEKYNGNY
jgi:hypothetical protein